MVDGDISRRSVLKGVGAGVGSAAAAGMASGNGRVEVNVGFKGQKGRKAAERAAANVKRRFQFDAMTMEVPRNALRGLQNNPNIRYVEENGRMHALAQTLTWGVDRVDADVLHDNGETGNGADIAILDTGIDSDHPDLENNVGAGKAWAVCDGSNGATCNYDWDDDNDHGTHCAGIADAVDNTEGVVGVSTEATLHALKVLDSSGGGSFSDIAAAIEYTADQGWDVASMSLGASTGSSTVKDACQYAYDNGVLLVAAAGNDGPCSDCVGYPAAYSTVIAVSSTESDDSLSDFSSTGSEVELAAPGGDIESTVIGGYDTFSGTSMACPHVSGAGGQLMANGYTNKEARTRLQNTAEDIGLASNEQGNGLLDAENAVLGGDTSLAVSTGSATNVGTNSATLNGSLDDLGGASSADVYFEWGPSGGSLSNTTGTQTLSSTGSFSADVSGLNAGTEYEFRAVADASDGDSDNGSLLTFTTGSDSSCVDASNWPSGTGVDGYEHITQVDMDGQVVESSSDSDYYDFTCPDVVTVQQGGSFTVSLDYDDSGYDGHYANVYVDWDGDGSWSSSDETVIMENVSDDTTTYSATVDVPSDAATGATLARVRLSWDGFDGPTATGEYGEVNDFTVYVEESTTSCADATAWPDGSGSDGYEHIDQVDMDGQVVESSGENAYEDFTCPDVVSVSPGGSFDIAMDWDDAGYSGHYANVYVDWDGDGSWSSADETVIMENVDDDSTTATATVNVPSDAASGATLARVRLSWGGFDGPTATGEYGEVNDFTIYVE